MNVILSSQREDIVFLMRVYDRAIVEVVANNPAFQDVEKLGTVVALSILRQAEGGRTNPVQLQRHAVSQATTQVLFDSDDRLFHKNQRKPPPPQL